MLVFDVFVETVCSLVNVKREFLSPFFSISTFSLLILLADVILLAELLFTFKDVMISPPAKHLCLWGNFILTTDGDNH